MKHLKSYLFVFGAALLSGSCSLENTYSNTENSAVWLTPPEIIEALGPFDLDPCAPVSRPWDTASHHYTEQDDGLSKEWHGRIWLNPPYGRKTFTWIKRLANHGSGIAMIFARTDTKGFQSEVLGKASSIFLFEGRICFHKPDGSPGGRSNAPSCLVSYSFEDDYTIMRAKADGKIKGTFIGLSNRK